MDQKQQTTRWERWSIIWKSMISKKVLEIKQKVGMNKEKVSESDIEWRIACERRRCGLWRETLVRVYGYSSIQVEIVCMFLDCYTYLNLPFGPLFLSANDFCFIPSDLMFCLGHMNCYSITAVDILDSLFVLCDSLLYYSPRFTHIHSFTFTWYSICNSFGIDTIWWYFDLCQVASQGEICLKTCSDLKNF